MYSRCPHCNLQQIVTTEQLRQTRGLICCEVCRQSFDALPNLTEQADESVAPAAQMTEIFAAAKPATHAVWGLGSLGLLLLLCAQLAYFQGESLMRRAPVYQAFSEICHTLGCQLPAYYNPAAWSVSHTELQEQIGRRYWLTAALTNQAALVQALPVLKLSLTDYNGQIVAERLFTPQHYAKVTNAAANHTLAVQIPLSLSVPVGGFTLSLS